MKEKEAAARGRFQGASQIVRYNAPFYFGGIGALLFGGTILKKAPLPRALRVFGWCGFALAAWWLAASVAVSWWVYDASPLYRWRWLRDWFPEAPPRWANFHAGLDESTLALREFWGRETATLDFYDEAAMGEPSIRRARVLTPAPVAAMPARFDALPLETASLDAIFLLFAAHELRAPKQRELFLREVRRVLRRGGAVVIVEHVRDAANFAAFGPGFFHFLPRREWLRLARASGFRIEREETLTPFVRAWLWRKPETTDGA